MARKTIEERIAEKQKKEEQLANDIKRLKKQQKEIEEKKRIKRLIHKGAIFESLVKESKKINDDEYKELIKSFVNTDDFKLKLLEITELAETRITDEENAESVADDMGSISD